MIKAFGNVFRVPELRAKVFFTLALLAVFRLGTLLVLPGITPGAVGDVLGGAGAGILDLVSMVSGGALKRGSIFALGIMPYITATIILQLLVGAWPYLEQLSKEGESGRKKIRQYERYGTVGLCVVQGFMYLGVLRGSGVLGAGFGPALLAVLAMTCGTMILVWMGNMITERGVSNGASIIIMAGIISRLPQVGAQVVQYWQWQLLGGSPSSFNPLKLTILAAMFAGVVFAVVLVTQGQRRIAIQHPARHRGMRMSVGQKTYLPFRVNQAGVMPIIFASSFLIPLDLIFRLLLGEQLNWGWARAIGDLLQWGQFLYVMVFATLIFFFCFFWNAITFKPADIADNLKNYGSFIPGIRPGKATANYLEGILIRMTFAGAAFLSAIAVMPQLLAGTFAISRTLTQFYGGTGLLIVVGVALDMVERLESHLQMRHYEGFLTKGRIKGRR